MQTRFFFFSPEKKNYYQTLSFHFFFFFFFLRENNYFTQKPQSLHYLKFRTTVMIATWRVQTNVYFRLKASSDIYFVL
jgi:hypothetical protein